MIFTSMAAIAFAAVTGLQSAQPAVQPVQEPNFAYEVATVEFQDFKTFVQKYENFFCRTNWRPGKPIGRQKGKKNYIPEQDMVFLQMYPFMEEMRHNRFAPTNMYYYHVYSLDEDGERVVNPTEDDIPEYELFKFVDGRNHEMTFISTDDERIEELDFDDDVVFVNYKVEGDSNHDPMVFWSRLIDASLDDLWYAKYNGTWALNDVSTETNGGPDSGGNHVMDDDNNDWWWAYYWYLEGQRIQHLMVINEGDHSTTFENMNGMSHTMDDGNNDWWWAYYWYLEARRIQELIIDSGLDQSVTTTTLDDMDQMAVAMDDEHNDWWPYYWYEEYKRLTELAIDLQIDVSATTVNNNNGMSHTMDDGNNDWWWAYYWYEEAHRFLDCMNSVGGIGNAAHTMANVAYEKVSATALSGSYMEYSLSANEFNPGIMNAYKATVMNDLLDVQNATVLPGGWLDGFIPISGPAMVKWHHF